MNQRPHIWLKAGNKAEDAKNDQQTVLDEPPYHLRSLAAITLRLINQVRPESHCVDDGGEDEGQQHSGGRAH